MNQPTQPEPKMLAVPEHLLVAAVNTLATRVQGTYAELQPLIVGLQSCQAIDAPVPSRSLSKKSFPHRSNRP